MSTSTLTIALAQCNVTVGDLKGNAQKITELYIQASAQGADLVIFPELSLIGYPPEDLVLRPSFREEARQMAEELATLTKNGTAMIIGSVWEEAGAIHNAALLLDGGKVEFIQPKTILPNYGIFDEKRLFAASNGPRVVAWRDYKLGLLICEDMWSATPAEALVRQGADLLIVINASPFEAGKLAQRKEIAAQRAQAAGLPLVYVNLVGGQDDIVFDGSSFVISAQGELQAQLPEFIESLACLRLHQTAHALVVANPHIVHADVMGEEETLWQAMMLGLADYVEKNGFPGVLLGISGGIDSALSAALAVDALGSERVHGVMLPSPYTSKESVVDATELAKRLGIATTTIPITPAMQTFDEVLSPVFRDAAWMSDILLGGNLQARLRGITLMALSNRFGSLLLSTGNKSEIAVGYSTLYGDSCGGYNVLKDLYKTQVYQLAHWRNAHTPRDAKGPATGVIPADSITRAPSAELAPGQTDQDQLPPYALLDAILFHHLEGRMGDKELVAQGYAAETVAKVTRMVRLSEYKRRQSCPGVKLSSMLFGRDRRYPLTTRD